MAGNINRELRAELLDMERQDQALRQRLIDDGTLFDGYHPEMEEMQNRFGDRLGEIVAEHGWPGADMVGEDGAAAAWLVLQHAIGKPELMRGCLEHIKTAAAEGRAEKKHAAMLEDRIRVMEGKKQIYGTQYDWDENGEMNPNPIEDPDTVDARRAAVGLDTLAENTERIREHYKTERETPPEDFEKRRADMLKWARKTGWRR